MQSELRCREREGRASGVRVSWRRGAGVVLTGACVLQYVDLDEFLSENGMPGEALGGAHLGGSGFGAGAGLALGLQAPVTKRERSPSPSDCMSPDTINPPLSPADSSQYNIS